MPIVHSTKQRATVVYDPLRFAICKWIRDERAKYIKSKDLPSYRYNVKLCSRCQGPLVFAVRKDHNKSHEANLVGWCLTCGIPDFLPNCHARSKRKVVMDILQQDKPRVEVPLTDPTEGIEAQRRSVIWNMGDGQPVVRVIVKRPVSK